MSDPSEDDSTGTGEGLPRRVVPEADQAAAPVGVAQAATSAEGTEASDPPDAEPYLRLARAGAADWNRWQRTGMDAASVQRFKLDAIKPLSREDAAVLARRIGLTALPSHDRPPDFRRVDFTHEKNRRISFARFVFGIGSGTLFEVATFGFETGFKDAIFGDGTRFDGAIFGFKTHFDGATFGNRAGFEGATFGDGTRFDGATFGDRTRFDGATFGDRTRFDGAAFGDRTHFDGWRGDELRALLERVSQLRGSQAANATAAASGIDERLKVARPGHFTGISFVNAVFQGDARFCGREFEGEADFSHAVFRSVPDFARCNGLGNLDLSEVAVSFGGSRWWHLRNWTTEGKIDTRLRRLRKIAKDVEAGDLERDLFILERKAQRGRLFSGPTDPWPAAWNRGRPHDRASLSENLQELDLFRMLGLLLRLLGLVFRPLGLTLWLFLYGITSDYGRSIIRPLAWLVVSFFGFLGLYRWQYNAYCGRPFPLTNPDLMSFTLGNSLPFLSSLNPARRDVLLRLFGEHGHADRVAIPFAIETLSSIQSILGAVLLFLLLLAIRNRFRLA